MADQYGELEKLVKEGSLSIAEPRLLDWLQYHPNDSRAWLLYGKCVTNPAQKRNCFKRALDLDPSNLEARELLEEFGTATLQSPPTNEQSGVNIPFLPISSPAPTKPSPSFVLSGSPVLLKQAKTRLPVILYSLFHFLLTILFGIILVFVFSTSVPELLRINKPDDNIQRNWLSNAIPADSNQEIQDLAGIFLNPSRLNYRQVSSYQELRSLRTSIALDSSESKVVEFKGVSFVGQLVSGSILQSGNEGQPLVVVMNIVFDETRIPVVYYGPADNFDYEDTVLVEGVYIEEGNGFIAQRVEKLSTRASVQVDTDTLIGLRVAVGVLLYALFCFSVFFWAVNLKRWRQEQAGGWSSASIVIFLLPLAVLITGCTIDLSTTLRPDGTGITSILAHESRENMEFLRSAPGVPGYLSAVVRDIKNSGALFEQYIEGDQESFFIQRYFNNLSTEVVDSYPIEGSWVYVQRYREGTEEVMRFMSVIDTRTLYNNPDQADPNVANALRDQLNQIDMKYHLNFPGRLVYHNGGNIVGQQVSWQIRMNEVNYLIAEVRLPVENDEIVTMDVRYVWLTLGFVFAVSTAFLVSSFRVRPSRKRDKRKL